MKLKNFFVSTIILLSWKALACPNNTTARNENIGGKPSCTLSGNHLNEILNLKSDFSYVLEGDTRFGGDNNNSSILNIEPGTTIYGAPGSFLVILRGSKIYANGTSVAPVVFTALQRENLRPGLWGGVVVNGNARINNCKPGTSVCEGSDEGIKENVPLFGGNNDADNSGKIKYTRIEYAGYELSKDNELNGLTLYGVGSATEIDYVQILRSADDGIEVFGGTVNLRHIIISDSDDDGLDWDMGWRGYAQFVWIDVNNGSEESNGIEADNLKSPMTAEPRSNPTLSNVTIVGHNEKNPRLFSGILLRRGTGAQIYNTIVTGTFKVACINLDDEETFRFAGTKAENGVVQTGTKIVNTLVKCDAGNNFDEQATDLYPVSSWFKGINNENANQIVDPKLIDFYLPEETSPVVGAGKVPVVSGSWQFTPVDFIGAFSPYADEDWSLGWSNKAH
ncbi:MAG: hypothetical protein K1X29_09865 [Bdellovibrionales bacterium]|nr:hypothetical protein [Bdellovibrionales bacterium]